MISANKYDIIRKPLITEKSTVLGELGKYVFEVEKSAEKGLIKKAIENRLTTDPIGFGKPLRYSLKGYRRLRVSDYRIVYRIEQEAHMVVIVAIKHRKDIYDDF